MNDKFDELAKGLAQSVTRRGALKKFGVGLAGLALVALGLPNQVEAGGNSCKQLSCTDGFSPRWTEYACGGKPDGYAHNGIKCYVIGKAPCGYCTNCC